MILIAQEATVRAVFSILVATTILVMVGCAQRLRQSKTYQMHKWLLRRQKIVTLAVDAPLELKFATDKLTKARTALQAESMRKLCNWQTRRS